MEYQALYRKYRPQRFEEVVGQEHVTQTLKREIADGRVAHAYLFAGPRGTGKTTTARLLAKSLNCPNRDEAGEPCDDCVSCKSVATANSMDVIELDAASHNKVEDIRDIRISVSTVASVGGAKRVFILDEAHMLTKAASNALLKTLEEPPDHVHFVLATTEPYKLLDTIRSRSQRFDFHLITAETLVDHLRAVSEAEGYATSPDALMSVARHAAGSARDGLSLLEQVAALGNGVVEESGVQRALGLAGRDVYLSLVRAIRDSDAKAGLELIAGLAARGIDLRKFLGDAISFFRGAFLAKYSPNIEELSDEPEDVIADWKTAAGELLPASVLRSVDVLSEALVKLREGREERLMVELAILKLTRPELADDAGALAARVEKLERVPRPTGPTASPTVSASASSDEPSRPAAVAEVVSIDRQQAPESPTPDGQVADTATSGESVADNPVEESPISEAREPDESAPDSAEPAIDELQVTADLHVAPTMNDLDRIWPQLVAAVRDDLGARREALFREAMPGSVEGSTLVLTVPASMGFHLEQLVADDGLRTFVSERASSLLGGSVAVDFRSVDEDGDSRVAPVSEPEPDPIPDKDSLAEAPADGTDPLALLEDAFGATVVDDED